MGKMLFKRVDYKLDNLIMDIESGRLGLPDLQRPFIWQNSKVRELLDSMMKGYPIGYLLLWDSPSEVSGKQQIGNDGHTHENPKQLIIDGQQRLTSLYAVMRGKEVRDSKYKNRRIRIAFHPLDRKFEVASAAHRRDPEWIEDVSDVFKNANGIRKFTNTYIKTLRDAWVKNGHDLSEGDEQKIDRNISELLQLKDYSIPTLDIGEQANEEDVADIFVRVNSGGKSLNETDFILTLISVHDEEQRRRIEDFCREATVPQKSGSSYNQLMEPKSSHIIRAVMAYGFKRAQLRYAYMMLRGKDMDTGDYSEELRNEKFKELKEKLDKVLDLNNWHEFIKCIISAGYVSSRLIAAENALVYTYVMYLIGKHDFKIEASALRKLVAKWFFMTSASAYYSSSTETRVQADLNDLRNLKNATEFSELIDRKIRAIFTKDFFEITLPEHLSTSAAISPAWFAYCAAQNILDSRALFSKVMVRSLFSPGASGSKASVEKHHLFPKSYLKEIGISENRERNQIANFAYIEWHDNLNISDMPPSEYWDKMSVNFQENEIKEMMQNNALPSDWENMSYQDFLVERRKLIAEMIRKGYERL